MEMGVISFPFRVQDKSPEESLVSVLERKRVCTETDEKQTCLITFPSSPVIVAVIEEKRPSVKTSSAPNERSRYRR